MPCPGRRRGPREEEEMESLGGYLRKQRELQQLSVAEIAQTTRIPARILRLIENDRFDELPADVFVRGFLRAYAHAVGLEETGARVGADLAHGQVQHPGYFFGAVALHPRTEL